MKLRSWLEVGGGAALLLVATVAWEQAQRVRDEALRADKAEALADTTRRLVTHTAADRALWQRRAVQEAQRADSVDRELGLTRKAYVAATVTIRGLEAAAHAPVTEDSSARRATFHVREVPFTAEATVALPPPPAAGDLQLRIALDPIPLDLRLECGAAEGGGVHQASAVLSGPPWATVQLGRVEQAPEVCSPKPALLSFGSYTKGLETGGLLGIALVLLTHFVFHMP